MGLAARIVALCVSCLFSALPGFAATVCVLVVESGLPPDSARVEASSAWEAGLMGAFFDAGHIVTNGPLIRSSEGPDDRGAMLPELDFGIEAAKEGGADYLVLAVLNYGKQTKISPTAIRPSPDGIAYRMLELGTGAVIAEGTEEDSPKMASSEEEARKAGEVARIIMKRLKER